MKEEIINQNQRIKSDLETVKNALEKYAQIDPSFKGHTNTMNTKINSLIEQIDKKSFTVAVIATMKAGKSTLLNALLGNDYLPTSNTPETASLLYIKHSADCYLQANDEKIYDIQNICNAIRERNRIFRESGVDMVSKYTLFVPYEKISTVKNVNFQFIDTPGPNEAGISALKDEVEKVLKMADVILYVMNYTQLNGQEEEKLFDTVTDIRRDILSEIKDRFFFVISQIDRENANSKTIPETVEYVKECLKKRIGITEPSIHCVSAEWALLSRMVQAQNFSRIDDLGEIVYGKFSPLYDRDDTLEEKKEKFNDELLSNIIKKSGVPKLEDEIIDYIVNNSESLFYRSIIEKSKNAIQDAKNLCLAKQSVMYKSQEELERDFTELKASIEAIGKDLKEIDDTVHAFCKTVDKEIKEKFDLFDNKIGELIENLITHEQDEDNNDGKSDWLGNILDTLFDVGIDIGVEVVAAKLKGNKNCDSGNKGSKSGKGMNQSQKNTAKKIGRGIYKFGKTACEQIHALLKNGKLTSFDEQKARETIETINNSIESVVQVGLSQLKDDLEATISLKNEETNHELEVIINRANTQFFSKLNEQFSLPSKLEAVPIELPKEDSITIETDYNNFLDKKYKYKDGGFCKPKLRVLDDVSLNTDKLISYWKGEIKTQKRISLKVISDYMAETVLTRIESIKKNFKEKTDDYLRLVSRELESKKKEQSTNSERETELKTCISQIDEVKDFLNTKL